MGNAYVTNPLIFLVRTLFGLGALVVMLRFFLQLMRADFYNPISQFVIKTTAPVLRPLRRVIPGLAGLDLAALVLAWLLKALELSLILLLLGVAGNLFRTLFWAIPELVGLILNIFLFAIIIQVILSWVSNPYDQNPVASLVYSLSEPLLRPARRLLPPISGLDLSPMLVTVGLVLLKMLLLPPLKLLTGSPF